MKPTRKSTDGLGVVIWHYPGNWRIVRVPAEHTMHGNHRLYTIERMANWRGEPPYKWAGNTISLKSARIVLREATRAAA